MVPSKIKSAEALAASAIDNTPGRSRGDNWAIGTPTTLDSFNRSNSASRRASSIQPAPANSPIRRPAIARLNAS